MEIADYIDAFEIDVNSTEGIDFLIEVIVADLVLAENNLDWTEAERLRDLIESLPNY